LHALLVARVRTKVPFSAYLFYKVAGHPGSEPDDWGAALDPAASSPGTPNGRPVRFFLAQAQRAFSRRAGGCGDPGFGGGIPDTPLG